MLRCPRCHGRSIQSDSAAFVPPGRRACRTCGFSGTDAAFQTASSRRLNRAKRRSLHSAHWSARHARRPPVLNRVEELGVGIGSLLLGALSVVPFPAPGAVPASVWALTVSAFVFLVLFVAAHIWKAHSPYQGPIRGPSAPSRGRPGHTGGRGKKKTGKKKKDRR